MQMTRQRKHISDPEARWARRNHSIQRVRKREAVAKEHAQRRRLEKRQATLPSVVVDSEASA